MPEDANELTPAKIDGLVHELRGLGLYENSVQRFSPQDQTLGEDGFFGDVKPEKTSRREILVMDFLVGEVAFSKRVQAPEEAATDATFESLARQFEDEEFESLRAEIAARLAEGKDPFGSD